MTLPAVLVVVVLLEGLAAAGLVAAAARFRVSADHHLAIEAELAVNSALALARVSQGAAIAGIPPGTVAFNLPAPALPGWDVTIRADREGGDAPVRLTAEVRRASPGGAPSAVRHATLLLRVIAADTAIVLPSRERF
jgi:type II secretory pathway pseudopilin PulG